MSHDLFGKIPGAPEPTETIHPAIPPAALALLRTAEEADAWDLEPVVFLVSDMVVEEGTPTCVRVPIPTEAWVQEHPANVLLSVSFAVQGGLITLDMEHPVTTESIVGAILLNEGHGITGDKVTIDERNAGKRIEDMTGNRELRMATMIDRRLTPALMQHIRGDSISEDVIHGFEGRIPTALSRFMLALMTTWMDQALRN